MSDRKEIEIKLNLIVQKLLSKEEGEEWFINSTLDKKKRIINSLIYFVLQSSSTSEEIKESIQHSGLKESYTSCKLLLNGPLKIQLAKIATLPESESFRSFQLLISLFTISDERRRTTQCKNVCSHWWHNINI